MNGSSFPIRLLSLQAENFRGLAGAHSLALDSPLTLLIGSNGAGKSSFLGAIEWCLFGALTTKKSGSGIAERSEWALAHHDAAGDVSATLEFKLEGGTARLSRRRAVDSKARDEDELTLHLPDDELLRDQEVQDWLNWNHMPDWATWKRSFCQHQELSRERVTDSSARSDAIASMLGLEEFRQVNNDLKGLKIKRLEECATNELTALHNEQQRALERPAQELRELETRLDRAGLAVSQVGEAEYEKRKNACLDSARKLAAQLKLEAAIPTSEASASEFTGWTRSWPTEIRRKLDSLDSERRALAKQVETLASSAEALEPARRSEADALRAQERLTAELGSLDQLARQRTELTQKRNDLEEQLRTQDAAGKLIRDALGVVKSSANPEHCPVCDQERSNLEQVIQSKLSAGSPDALRGEFESLEQRDSKLREQSEQLTLAQRTLESSRTHVRTLEDRVRGQLPVGTDASETVNDLLRTWRDEERAHAGACEAAEGHLAQQRDEVERLELLAKLHQARARANMTAGEISDAPEFQALQQVIDEAAGFASDLDALGAIARDLEDHQSQSQVTAVNASINTHYQTITGPESREVRIKVKKTAAKVAYQLVDDKGRVITSILNQAAFNALSLAALFASAECRAREGQPQFLILDDPGQSLDPEHQAGLARSVANCAKIAPVILGTYPGELANALAGADAQAKTYRLARNQTGDNTLIREA